MFVRKRMGTVIEGNTLKGGQHVKKKKTNHWLYMSGVVAVIAIVIGIRLFAAGGDVTCALFSSDPALCAAVKNIEE